MKKKIVASLLSLALSLGMTTSVFAGTTTETLNAIKVDKSTQPRILITTDLEVDDMNGVILSLMYSTDYDLAGIVWTAGKFHFSGDGKGTKISEAIADYYVYDGSEKAEDAVPYDPGFECNAVNGFYPINNETGEVYTDQDRIQKMDATEWRPVDPNYLNHLTDLYAQDYPNLVKNNPNYPTPEYIKSISKVGNIAFEGDYREDTEGSDLIKKLLLDDDMRPLYVQHWGGCNTTIRALYSIYEDYHNEDGSAKEGWDAVLNKVVSKFRYSGQGEDNCWAYSKIDEMFPGLKSGSYSGFASLGNYWRAVPFSADFNVVIPISPDFIIKIHEGTNDTINPYYRGTFFKEAFKLNHGKLLGEFHLMNDGQFLYGEPSFYQYGLMNTIDWREGAKYGYATGEYNEVGSYYTFDDYDWMCCQFGCNSYVDLGLRQNIGNKANDEYLVALWNDIAARADWAIAGPADCNHAPVVSADQSDVEGVVGEKISLTGTVSDPDNDQYSIKWWVPANSCTYKDGKATNEDLAALVADTNSTSSEFVIPSDANVGDKFVVNMEVTDAAERPMTRYAQFTVTVKEGTLAPAIDISKIEVSSIKNYTYTGKEIAPVVTVKYDGEALVEGTDYSVEYSNNVAVGQASVKVTGLGDYAEYSNVVNFNITKASQTIKAANSYSIVKGKTKTINAAVSAAAGTAGKLTYKSSNAKVAAVDANGKITAKGYGTATITVTAAATDTCNKAAKTITVNVIKAKQNISAANTVYVTKGKTKKISASVTAEVGKPGKLTYKSSNTKVATVDANGKITAKGYGTATITVTAAGTPTCDKAVKTITVKVVLPKVYLKTVSNRKSGLMKVTWFNKKDASGYQVAYSTSPTFENAKYVSTTALEKSVPVTKGKTYYVKVRAYKTVNGTKMYGYYSKATKLTIKK